jgi:hypothetical protein
VLVDQQLERHCSLVKDSPAQRKYVKRAMSKARRRAAKRDPENAAKHPMYHGYTG